MALTTADEFCMSVIINDIQRVRVLLAKHPECRFGNPAYFPPLHTAARMGYHEMLKVLIEESKEDLNSGHETPLSEALEHGIATTQLLLDLGADIDARGTSGLAPIHRAICMKMASPGNKMYEFLVSKGAKVYIPGSNLHPAVMRRVCDFL